jgi:hypothetical protein
MNNEPVAWINRKGKDGEHGYLEWDKDDEAEINTPLYTHSDQMGLAESIIKQQELRIAELESLCKNADNVIGMCRIEIEFLRQHLKAYGISVIENCMKEVYAEYTKELGKAQEK